MTSAAVSTHPRTLSDEATVFIVDDDPDVRRTVSLLAKSVDLSAEQFASPHSFLKSFAPQTPGCLVLDMRMPGMSGLELQKELKARNIRLPIVFVSAHGEISHATTAMRAGAVDFIPKPFSPQMLLERIQEAITLDRHDRAVQQRLVEVQARIKTLTDREHEVMQLLAEGESTKSIAATLHISPKTVDNHRVKVLEKMDVDNAAQLNRLVSVLD